MSGAVIHNNTVYLSGQVGDPEKDIKGQTEDCLAKVDDLLSKAGTDKTRLLQVTIWLKEMDHFAAMNEVYDAWVVAGHKPARACGESQLARDSLLVEVIATAAK
jgi:enamine deaminase RidA (YjgF/YER057c/UK114 family)